MRFVLQMRKGMERLRVPQGCRVTQLGSRKPGTLASVPMFLTTLLLCLSKYTSRKELLCDLAPPLLTTSKRHTQITRPAAMSQDFLLPAQLTLFIHRAPIPLLPGVFPQRSIRFRDSLMTSLRSLLLVSRLSEAKYWDKKKEVYKADLLWTLVMSKVFPPSVWQTWMDLQTLQATCSWDQLESQFHTNVHPPCLALTQSTPFYL